MKILKLGTVLFLFFLMAGCNSTEPESGNISFNEIQMTGVDQIFMGGDLEVIIRTESEYKSFLDENYNIPLKEHWDENYERISRQLKEENPNLSEEEIQKLTIDRIYKITPFYGLKDYEHPDIDFEKYTLLGQNADSWGCSEPEYLMEVTKNGLVYNFNIKIKRFGSCEMAIARNK